LRSSWWAAAAAAAVVAFCGCARSGGGGFVPVPDPNAGTNGTATPGPGSGPGSGTGTSGSPTTGNPGSTGMTGPVPGGATSGQPPAAEGRALWVTRWHANTEAKIRSAVDHAVAHRFNILLVQVYGDSFALYPSQLAPRSSLVSASFDALESAVRLGHAAGLEVHAWMNVSRVFTGTLARPSSAAHVVNAHPEWTMVRSNGARSIDGLGTAAEIWFCPEHDGFRDHLAGIAGEMARRYEVDGVHLDYVRMPGTDYCYCDEHRRKFQARFGRAPAAGDADWLAFRHETITRLVAAVHQRVGQERPRARISAAITQRPTTLQDPRTWFRQGILDIAFPMLYTSNVTDFAAKTAELDLASNGRHVMPGIGVDWGKIGEEIDAARAIGVEGFAIFASNQLTAAHDPILNPRLATALPPPACPWRDGTPDLTPPVHTVPTVAAAEDQASVEWRTDERTTGRVEVWLDSAAPGAAPVAMEVDATLGWDHRVVVRGLAAGTTYRYHVVSIDPAGNWRSSADRAFTTLAASTGPVDVIVDDGGAGFVRTGSWSAGSSAGGNAGGYLFANRVASESATAAYRPTLPRDGTYRVSVWYVAGTNRSTDAAFRVAHRGGASTVRVNQQQNGRQWVSLGTFTFDAGTAGAVTLSNAAATGSVVIADAVRFERVGP